MSKSARDAAERISEMLKLIVEQSPFFVEARFHEKISQNFLAQKGRLDVAHRSQSGGVGIRVFANGAWGFSATSHIEQRALQNAYKQALTNANNLSRFRKGTFSSTPERAASSIAKTVQLGNGYQTLHEMSQGEKIFFVLQNEAEIKKQSSRIESASCQYREILESKVIVTSDGAHCIGYEARPEIRFTAFAVSKGEQQSASIGAGITGDWNSLLTHPSLHNGTERVAKTAIDLLKAKYAREGTHTVILAPSVVGLLCHEAIGHTVEADYVKSGSIAQHRLGTVIGSPFVNISDAGESLIRGGAAGSIVFDDEGSWARPVAIVESGVLKSYLHNSESAHEAGLSPTGNARAWSYDCEPLIRMRNTYMHPGTASLKDMIASIDDGYFVAGDGGGEADNNGEFMFGASMIWQIKKGKLGPLKRESTLSGRAFEVLASVDAVSEDFSWDLGTGYCGKGQPAKVDAGGPYVRCRLHIGGR